MVITALSLCVLPCSAVRMLPVWSAGTEIRDEGCEALSRALQSNRTLTSFSFLSGMRRGTLCSLFRWCPQMIWVWAFTFCHGGWATEASCAPGVSVPQGGPGCSP